MPNNTSNTSTHYKPRRIAEIDFRNDTKVALIGRVAAIGENNFTLEDEKGKVEIIFEKLNSENVKPEKFYRIFCSVVEKRLQADIVQNLNSFDPNLFNKVEELYRKSGV